MPDVRLPNGKIIKNVPANMTPEEKARFAELAQSYSIPGLTDTAISSDIAERKAQKEWAEARGNLSKTRDLRYKALRSIDTPAKLAEAYGFKPEDFNPVDLQAQFDAFQTKLGSGDWWNKKAPGLGAFLGNLGEATLAPAMFAKQVYARSTGSNQDVNSNTLGNMVDKELLAASTGDKPVSSFIGAAIGSTPIALATGGNAEFAGPIMGKIVGSTAGGSLTAMLTPNTSQNSMFDESFKKGLVGGALGLGGGLFAHALTAAPKGAAFATKKLPPLAAEDQALAGRALGLQPSDISAADLVRDARGIKTFQSDIVGWRNNAAASGKTVAKKNEGNLARMNQTATELADGTRAAYENTPFINGENPQSLNPRQAIQESLPLEQARRQEQIVSPLYDAVAPRPEDAVMDTSPIIVMLDDSINKMRGSGKGSKYTSPMTTGREGQSGPSALNVLEEQRSNLVGDPSRSATASDHLAITPTPGRGPVVGGGETIPEVRDIYGTVIKEATPPAQMTTGPIPSGSGAKPWDSVYGLMRLRENLQHNINQYGFGNAQTRPITEVLKAVDEILANVHASPEWQAHLASLDAAKAGAAKYTKPYQQDVVQNLLQKQQGGQTVTPDQAFSTLSGYQPDQIKMIRGLLEQKGVAGLDTSWLDNLIAGARSETMPTGLQVQRAPLMEGIASPQTQAALSPEVLARLNEVKRALELMDQIGTRQPSTAPAATLAVAPASDRGILRAGWELVGKMTAPMLYNERIKAMLLTPSFQNSNLVPGVVRSGAQNFLSAAPGATSGGYLGVQGIENPMPR